MTASTWSTSNSRRAWRRSSGMGLGGVGSDLPNSVRPFSVDLDPPKWLNCFPFRFPLPKQGYQLKNKRRKIVVVLFVPKVP